MRLLSNSEINFLLQFRQNLSNNSIEYVLLRGWEALPKSVENDLDFLTPELKNMESELRVTAEALNLSIKCIALNYGFKSFLIDDSLQIDIFDRLVKKWIPYYSILTVLENAMTSSDSGFLVPLRVDYILMQYIKECLTYGGVRDRKLIEMTDADKASLLIKLNSQEVGQYIDSVSIERLKKRVRRQNWENITLKLKVTNYLVASNFAQWFIMRLIFEWYKRKF